MNLDREHFMCLDPSMTTGFIINVNACHASYNGWLNLGTLSLFKKAFSLCLCVCVMEFYPHWRSLRLWLCLSMWVCQTSLRERERDRDTWIKRIIRSICILDIAQTAGWCAFVCVCVWEYIHRVLILIIVQLYTHS